jgi:peptidoglycan/xylan/chitin deacetylase (PgdA/CDA1 family)
VNICVFLAANPSSLRAGAIRQCAAAPFCAELHRVGKPYSGCENSRETLNRPLASYALTMYARARAMLFTLDRLVARSSLAMGNEEGVLLTFLFHSLFSDTKEAQSGLADPRRITVEMFRRFLDHFQNHSYTFVSPSDISRGLDPSGKHVLVTFDDGYYSNTKALPLLEAFRVPAVLFVSTQHVIQGKAFWWDVLERRAHSRGIPRKQIQHMVERLKRLKTSEAESQVCAQFGADALGPVSDVDRPFTPLELRDFAAHSLISLGNHTTDHAILTNYSPDEVRAQIQEAQNDLEKLTGKTPTIIAYPNGNETPAIVDAARSAGIRFGLGVHPGRNSLPIEAGSQGAMTLKRFTLTGDCAIEAQCRVSRSLFSLYRVGRRVKRKMDSGFSPLQPA